MICGMPQPALSERVGARLRRLREGRRWTLENVADRLGVVFSTVQRWEHGAQPGWDRLEDIAGLFGVSPCDLICEEAIAPREATLADVEGALRERGAKPEDADDLRHWVLQRAQDKRPAPTVGMVEAWLESRGLYEKHDSSKRPTPIRKK